MTDQTPSVDSIALGLPREWVKLPLDKGEFEEAMTEQLRELKDRGISAPQRRRLELLRRQLRDLLLAQQVVYVSVVAMVAGESEENEDELEVVTAAVAVSIQDRTDIGAPNALDVGMLVKGLTSGEQGDGTRELDPPVRIELPVGPAVRLARLHQSPIGDGVALDSIVQTFLVPYDKGERLCTVQFVTPNIEHGGSFSALFDAIAETLRIFREGEATDFADPDVGRAG